MTAGLFKFREFFFPIVPVMPDLRPLLGHGPPML